MQSLVQQSKNAELQVNDIHVEFRRPILLGSTNARHMAIATRPELLIVHSSRALATFQVPAGSYEHGPSSCTAIYTHSITTSIHRRLRNTVNRPSRNGLRGALAPPAPRTPLDVPPARRGQRRRGHRPPGLVVAPPALRIPVPSAAARPHTRPRAVQGREEEGGPEVRARDGGRPAPVPPCACARARTDGQRGGPPDLVFAVHESGAPARTLVVCSSDASPSPARGARRAGG